MKDKICTICGVEIKNAYGKTKYCTTCRELARVENLHRWQAAQKKPQQALKCAVCGKEIVRTCSNSKYCVDCRTAANKEVQAEYKRSINGVYKTCEKPIKAKTSVAKKTRTIKGEYRGDAFFPLVAVKQPKTSFTYNDIKRLADVNGVTYAKQAKSMGI